MSLGPLTNEEVGMLQAVGGEMPVISEGITLLLPPILQRTAPVSFRFCFSLGIKGIGDIK